MVTDDQSNSDQEKGILAAPHEQKPVVAENALSTRFWALATVNTIATAALIFSNKRIFEDERLKHAQVSFAAFHFAMAGVLLFILSRPGIGLFQAKMIHPIRLLPLSIAMIFSVVLPNASLAYSSIQFYQVTRVLLTPCVAAINFIITRTVLPRPALLSLIPVCAGVGVISYFDTMPSSSNGKAGSAVKETHTTQLGVFYAIAGVLASSLYAVWIKRYHQLFECNSMQLLLNQAPASVIAMLFAIPFTDDLSGFAHVSRELWILILVSGVVACIFNTTQYLIINEAGPVSSTVLGHAKRILIIALGWMQSRRPLLDGSMAGVVLAIGGIAMYSYIMQTHCSS